MSNAPGSWSQAPHVKLTTATVPGAIALMAIVPRGRDLPICPQGQPRDGKPISQLQYAQPRSARFPRKAYAAGE